MLAVERTYPQSTVPLHTIPAVLLAGTVPLFLGVLLTDFTYFSTYELQWKNFASWLIVGGLIFGGFALLWLLIELFDSTKRGRLRVLSIFFLLATFVLGFINALVHAQDAWESMPEALVLSALGTVLAITATVLAFSTLRAGGRR